MKRKRYKNKNYSGQNERKRELLPTKKRTRKILSTKMAQSTSHQVSSSGLCPVQQLDQYLTAVELTSADMVPAMSPVLKPLETEVDCLQIQLFWLMWQYDATKIQHNQKTI